MIEGEGAHREVERIRRQRQVAEVALGEVALGHLRLRARQHLRRSVDTHDAVAAVGEASSVAAGAARGVEGTPGSRRVQHRPHGRLLHADQRIAGLVVGGRPGRVPVAHVELGRHRGQTERRVTRFVDQSSDLCDPGGGLLVVTDEQPAQQGQAFDAHEQLAQVDVPQSRVAQSRVAQLRVAVHRLSR